MEGWKKVGGHAAVGDASPLLLLLLLLVCLLDTPQLSLLPTVHPPQNITNNLCKQGTRGRYVFAGPAPLTLPPSLYQPIQFPAPIGVICALGNPPWVTWRKKLPTK